MTDMFVFFHIPGTIRLSTIGGEGWIIQRFLYCFWFRLCSFLPDCKHGTAQVTFSDIRRSPKTTLLYSVLFHCNMRRRLSGAACAIYLIQKLFS